MDTRSLEQASKEMWDLAWDRRRRSGGKDGCRKSRGEPPTVSGPAPVLAVEWGSSGHVTCAGSRHTVVSSEEPGGEDGEGLTWGASS